MLKNKKKITLLVLSLNEIEGIKKTMPLIDHSLFYEIIFIDGGSNDGTLEYINNKKYKLIIQNKPGLGSAYIEGINNSSGDIIILFSPDGNSDPERLVDLIKLMHTGCDIGIVSRYLDWAESKDDDLITGFGNWMFTNMYNILFNQKVSDLLVIYRAFRREVVSELSINHGGIAWTTQMMCRAAKSNYIIKEIPGNEPIRIGGIRKMKPFRNGCAELVMLTKEFFVR